MAQTPKKRVAGLGLIPEDGAADSRGLQSKKAVPDAMGLLCHAPATCQYKKGFLPTL